jgi:Mg-chelatase subunit ChlD
MFNFKNAWWCGAAALAAVLALGGAARADVPARPDETAKKAARPEVEVVFCLDTTGSMGGLINAAKQKIWAISNQIASGKPTPRLKLGLVAYRDRGDAYVTKVFDLTDDLDAIHAHLMSFQAQGGGDFPESVNQALHEAVTKVTWSKDKRTLKLIFLVGDAPPHMDYPDDVKYPETCKLAVQKDIIINTVQCGNHAETEKIWRDICRRAEGSYVQIDARGGPVVVVRTPYDGELAKINGDLARSTLTYGSHARQAEGQARAKAVAGLGAAPGGAPVAAERAAYFARTGGGAAGGARYDLLDAVKSGKVKLKDVKKEELPAEMQKMTPEEQEAHLKKLDERRAELNKRAAELDRKRGEFIAKKLAEDSNGRARDSFDNQVLRILERQAARINVRYAADDSKK